MKITSCVFGQLVVEIYYLKKIIICYLILISHSLESFL